MKLKAFLLATALALASCTMTGAKPVQITASSAVAQEQDEPIQDLGDGFLKKERRTGSQRLILLHFPESAYLTDEASYPIFKAALKKVLVRIFTSAAFKTGEPEFFSGPQGEVLVNAGDDTFEVDPLYETGDHSGPIVGVVLIHLVRA